MTKEITNAVEVGAKSNIHIVRHLAEILEVIRHKTFESKDECNGL